jgi:DNA-binding LacI/PurR family transcriptional regulator
MNDDRKTRPRRSKGQLVIPANAAAGENVAKYRRIFDHLFAGIQAGELRPGDRLPSEAELGRLFAASRITVAKAVLDLQRLGLVSRRPGAGTHVLRERPATGRTFGLLVPELGLAEIFEPVCQGMMHASSARPDALLWRNASTAGGSSREAENLAQSFIQKGVAGVFFAPFELAPDKDTVNRRIVRSLERARIPLVLLDRCYLPYPERSAHDLVGIDNRRAGFMATDHLQRLGARRLVFLAEGHASNALNARITGFLECLRSHGIESHQDSIRLGDPQDEVFVRKLLHDTIPEGIVCANDITAARVMQVLLGNGVRIPDDVRIVGIDDAKYAGLLPVPLTTIRPDCAGIGFLAMATMLERLEHPDLPVRDILAPIQLVVRRSCGTHLASPKANA